MGVCSGTVKKFAEPDAGGPAAQGIVEVAIGALLRLGVDHIAREQERYSQQEREKKRQAKRQRDIHTQHLLIHKGTLKGSPYHATLALRCRSMVGAGLAPNTFQIRPSGVASASSLEPSGRVTTTTKSSKAFPGSK